MLMSRPPHRLSAALPAAAFAAAAMLLVSGCSGSVSTPVAAPSLTFSPNAGTTPGMTGMSGIPGTGTPGSAAAPAGTDAPTTDPSLPAGSGAPQGANAVSIDNFAFVRPSLTVPVGATVTWTNHDGEPHTVVANDGSFHAPAMDTNATFSFTFPTAGTFDYICSVHPFMHGTVVVTK
jgi:amicyanin